MALKVMIMAQYCQNFWVDTDADAAAATATVTAVTIAHNQP